jgi:exopolyphosphatase/guanosine-5'-triphosphate,3'-diphosphate pyrophosphatase
MLKFAAIDIGSNAVRLLLSQVFVNSNEEAYFKKISLIRMPIRLGEDVFSDAMISDAKKGQLVDTMIGFKYLMEAYDPLNYAACATSAMREASNGEEIVEEVRAKSGISLQIIDGAEEARILYSNNIEQQLRLNRSHLYVDVGGGSTEISIFKKNKLIDSNSFNIGTIRLLKKNVHKSEWNQMKRWLKKSTADIKSLYGIGSGGNINKIFRLAGVPDRQPISYNKFKQIHHMLNQHTYEERIRTLGLRPDRADVIIPASGIYLSVMKWTDIKKMYVPQIGLADGLIHTLYGKYTAGE